MKRKVLWRKMLFPVMLTLLCVDCKEEGLRLKIKYDQIDGIKEKDPVIFQGNQVGTVTGVFYTPQGRYLVDVLIRKQFSNAATDHSRFFIVNAPARTEEKAVEVVQTQKGGTALRDGATVEGSAHSTAGVEEIWREFQSSLENLKHQFEELSHDLKKIPQSEKMKKLGEELERLSEEIKHSGQAARDKLEQEILPRLKRDLENLREWLKKHHREEELEPLEVEFEKLKKI